MKQRGCISLTYKNLRAAACTYISLPLFVFLGGFLKWYFALAGIAGLSFALYKAVRSDNVEPMHTDAIQIRLPSLAAVFAFVLLWGYLGGLNGYFYQSSDWNVRNAIFHDLIKFDWPIVYESTGAALVYYIGHWLPPALFGKIILLTTDSMRWAWFLGRMAMWGWTCLGLFIVVLLIFVYLRAATRAKRFWALAIFVLYSGLDIFGALRFENLDILLSPEILHMEWWSPYYQFTSMTACVYWVFNQVVIPWIITLCFLMERDARNYVFYCVTCLICGPFPCVGIAVCMLVKAVCYCAGRIRSHSWKGTLVNIFSPSNIVTVLTVVPFVAAYILANNAVGAAAAQETAQTAAAAEASGGFFSKAYWNGHLYWFVLFEVAIYMALIYADHVKDPLFYTLALTFVVVPYFKMGESNDFCMRVSVPGVFILMLSVNRFLLEHFTLKPRNLQKKHPGKLLRQVCALMLAVFFAFGAITPVVEVYRGIYNVVQAGTIKLSNYSLETFDNGEVYLNFNCANPEEQLFFKYMAR